MENPKKTSGLPFQCFLFLLPGQIVSNKSENQQVYIKMGAPFFKNSYCCFVLQPFRPQLSTSIFG